MVSKYIALIRGINVGRAKRVAMADLRALVEDLGFDDVRTLLNSGNIVFAARRAVRGDVAGKIEKALALRLGVSARVTVLTTAEFAEIVDENPLRKIADDPSRLLVAVLRKPEDRALLDALTPQDWTPDALAIGKHAVYLWCAQGILASKLAESVGRILGDGATTRNWATMTKLQALVAGER